MKRKKFQKFCIASGLLAAFLLWTIMVCRIDVQMVGPLEAHVGFATMNRFFHNLTGTHMLLYTITDWLSLVPLGFAAGFAMLGLVQWVKQKSLLKVDYNLLVMGVFYIAVLAVYVFFEMTVINYRPVLIDGRLEASYPSSTTILVLCIMPTAILQCRERLQYAAVRCWAVGSMSAFTALMVIGRLFSGVHWLSDIVGSVLLSAGLVMLYQVVIDLKGR